MTHAIVSDETIRTIRVCGEDDAELTEWEARQAAEGEIGGEVYKDWALLDTHRLNYNKVTVRFQKL